ncbi:MAG: glycosyltransferase family 4 protein [Fibrobacterota bacterium]
MKILFLTHYFPPEVNAPASRTYDNTKRWVKAGHDVTVITCAPNCPDGVVYEGYKNKLIQKEEIDGIKVVRLWTYLAPNAGTVKRILNYVSYMISAFLYCLFMKKPDIMIATSPQFFCGWAGVLLRKVRRFPFVLEIRDIWPESIITVGAIKNKKIIGFLEWMEKYMYKTAGHIVAVGKGYKNNITSKNVPDEKVSVIYNGVDLSVYQKSDNGGKVREEFGLIDKKVVSYIGTIGMAHGLEVVLEAARKTKGKDIVYLIVGDGARRKELQENAKKEGLENVVFTGRMPKDRMPEVWSAIDISLIHLKKSDLFKSVIPSKMFEAMAMEIPVIMGVAGEAGELVKESGAGVCMDPENAEELVEKIDDILGDEAKAKRLGENGRKFVEQRFNRDTLAEDYMRILEKVPGECHYRV